MALMNKEVNNCFHLFILSPASFAAASEVPQAAGGDPAATGASGSAGRAHQTAGARDQEHQELPARPDSPDLLSHMHSCSAPLFQLILVSIFYLFCLFFFQL